MNVRPITDETIGELLDRASWLKTEAESLKSVIGEIPYQDSMPGGTSVIQELFRLEYQQRAYYRPFFEQFRSDLLANLQLHDLQLEVESVESESKDLPDIEEILGSLVDERTLIVQQLNDLETEDWKREIVVGSEKITVFRFVEKMVKRDRQSLRAIAEIVLLFRQENEARRELKGASPESSTTGQNLNEPPPTSVE